MVEIVSTEDTLGGKPRLEGHRISVLQIAERAIDLGESPEEIADQVGISLAEVYAALAYYYEHAETMRQQRARRTELDESLQEAALDPPERVER